MTDLCGALKASHCVSRREVKCLEKVAELTNEIERNRAEIAELLEICHEFIRRVDCGEIRSKRTYAEMKAAIAKHDTSTTTTKEQM